MSPFISGNKNLIIGLNKLEIFCVSPLFEAMFISPLQKHIIPSKVMKSVTASEHDEIAALEMLSIFPIEVAEIIDIENNIAKRYFKIDHHLFNIKIYILFCEISFLNIGYFKNIMKFLFLF